MNFKLKDIGPQLMTVIAVVLVFGFFTYNAQVNMENRGIDFGYGFLSQESSFDVQFSLIEYDGSHSYFRAYLVGLLNTILVSVIGIILATILGLIVGIARLSPNYLINNFAFKLLNKELLSMSCFLRTIIFGFSSSPQSS